MPSSKKKYNSVRLQKIIKQISGEIDPENGALEPAYRVKGDGIIWCYSPIAKTMVRILRGSKAYLLQEITNENEETMIFVPYEVVYINKEELIEIGYN
jgi:hypothetical protein|tara:strand:+ start:7813 stop:8106 length:294 start_codon:yes stop_codon:yes gene_type:complete